MVPLSGFRALGL